jgi:hypothetical protein
LALDAYLLRCRDKADNLAFAVRLARRTAITYKILY